MLYIKWKLILFILILATSTKYITGHNKQILKHINLQKNIASYLQPIGRVKRDTGFLSIGNKVFDGVSSTVRQSVAKIMDAGGNESYNETKNITSSTEVVTKENALDPIVSLILDQNDDSDKDKEEANLKIINDTTLEDSNFNKSITNNVAESDTLEIIQEKMRRPLAAEAVPVKRYGGDVGVETGNDTKSEAITKNVLSNQLVNIGKELKNVARNNVRSRTEAESTTEHLVGNEKKSSSWMLEDTFKSKTAYSDAYDMSNVDDDPRRIPSNNNNINGRMASTDRESELIYKTLNHSTITEANGKERETKGGTDENIETGNHKKSLWNFGLDILTIIPNGGKSILGTILDLVYTTRQVWSYNRQQNPENEESAHLFQLFETRRELKSLTESNAGKTFGIGHGNASKIDNSDVVANTTKSVDEIRDILTLFSDPQTYLADFIVNVIRRSIKLLLELICNNTFGFFGIMCQLNLNGSETKQISSPNIMDIINGLTNLF